MNRTSRDTGTATPDAGAGPAAAPAAERRHVRGRRGTPAAETRRCRILATGCCRCLFPLPARVPGCRQALSDGRVLYCAQCHGSYVVTRPMYGASATSFAGLRRSAAASRPSVSAPRVTRARRRSATSHVGFRPAGPRDGAHRCSGRGARARVARLRQALDVAADRARRPPQPAALPRRRLAAPPPPAPVGRRPPDGWAPAGLTPSGLLSRVDTHRRYWWAGRRCGNLLVPLAC